MEKAIVDNYIISLLAKPFVVLTGNSGTGKTRLAMRVAEQLEKNNYKINTLLPIMVDNRGNIVNKTEEEIRDICVDSNVFIARVGNDEFEIQIEMNSQIKSTDSTFWELIDNNETTEITLGAAVRIPKEKRHTLIPVGADWTDTRNLLGYVNPFGPEGKTIYEITPMLQMIIKALHPDNRYLPHFIILDEMNLSHVERYFSTFLTAMEANRSTSEDTGLSLIEKNQMSIILDTLRMNENTDPKLIQTVEYLLENNKELTLPPNIFIIGTVNVDETTYMFSPKVLDRAHIIELDTIHPSIYFDGSLENVDYIFNSDKVLNHFKKSIEYRELEYQGNNPLDKLASKWNTQADFEQVKKEIENVLTGIYSILKPVNFDFGYRIFKETIEYLYFSLEFTQTNVEWEVYFDNVILQKVLPKLHGNRRQLNDALEILVKFLKEEKIDDYLSNITVTETAEDYIVDNGVNQNNLNLPRSIIKLNKMQKALENIGYTSFIS